MAGEILVVAGEASGDAMAAPVLERLRHPSFGLGGSALAERGLEPVAPDAPLGVMGASAALGKLPRLLRAFLELQRQAAKRRPRAALLVGFSEFNAKLGPRLRRCGIPVLWYAPPQVWAWRPGRAQRLSRAADRMAVILPFEQALWRKHGAVADYVGHPALEHVARPRSELRRELGLPEAGTCIAVLPGSRTAEVERHLKPMLETMRLLQRARGAMHARVLVAEALPRPVVERIRAACERAAVPVLYTAAPRLLPAFDVALAASGTVTIECALAGVPPLIVHSTDRFTAAIARRLLSVDSIGLPNIVLGERLFPELVQSDVRAERLAPELLSLLDRSDSVPACRRVRTELEAPLYDDARAPSARVAELIEPWLE